MVCLVFCSALGGLIGVAKAYTKTKRHRKFHMEPERIACRRHQPSGTATLNKHNYKVPFLNQHWSMALHRRTAACLRNRIDRVLFDVFDSALR